MRADVCARNGMADRPAAAKQVIFLCLQDNMCLGHSERNLQLL